MYIKKKAHQVHVRREGDPRRRRYRPSGENSVRDVAVDKFFVVFNAMDIPSFSTRSSRRSCGRAPRDTCVKKKGEGGGTTIKVGAGWSKGDV